MQQGCGRECVAQLSPHLTTRAVFQRRSQNVGRVAWPGGAHRNGDGRAPHDHGGEQDVDERPVGVRGRHTRQQDRDGRANNDRNERHLLGDHLEVLRAEVGEGSEGRRPDPSHLENVPALHPSRAGSERWVHRCWISLGQVLAEECGSTAGG